jgi:hypothetical protein
VRLCPEHPRCEMTARLVDRLKKCVCIGIHERTQQYALALQDGGHVDEQRINRRAQ